MNLGRCCCAALGTTRAVELVQSTVVVLMASLDPCMTYLLESLLASLCKWPLAAVAQRAMVLARFLLSDLLLF